MIYIKDDLDTISLTEYRLMYNRVSEQRKAYADRFCLQKDKLRCVCAYCLLIDALNKEYGIVNPPVFGFKEYGKPYLIDYPYIKFNISHCNNAVVCIISNEFVGVDIETISPINNSVINYTCNEEEIEQIESSICPEIEFAKIWTLKESYLKMLGLGLNNNIKDVLGDKTFVNCNHTIMVNESKRYVCSFCEMKE